MESFAPVLIPTLNRYEHLNKCITSLSRCTHADQTDLFIALDYPAKPEHEDGYKRICLLVNTIKGFKSVTIIKRNKNFGIPNNIVLARRFVFTKYDKLIITEDDNTFSASFLDYLNKGLTKFYDNEKVKAICGYNFPINMPRNYRHTYYFHKAFSGWGYAIWRSEDNDYLWGHHEVENFFSKKRYIRTLKKNFSGQYISWKRAIKDKSPVLLDSVITSMNIMNNTYSIFPTETLVVNHGHDGSGEHCLNDKDSIYNNQLVNNENLTFDYGSETPNYEIIEINNRLRRYFSVSLKKWIYFYIKSIFNHII